MKGASSEQPTVVRGKHLTWHANASAAHGHMCRHHSCNSGHMRPDGLSETIDVLDAAGWPQPRWFEKPLTRFRSSSSACFASCSACASSSCVSPAAASACCCCCSCSACCSPGMPFAAAACCCCCSPAALSSSAAAARLAALLEENPNFQLLALLVDRYAAVRGACGSEGGRGESWAAWQFGRRPWEGQGSALVLTAAFCANIRPVNSPPTAMGSTQRRPKAVRVEMGAMSSPVHKCKE